MRSVVTLALVAAVAVGPAVFPVALRAQDAGPSAPASAADPAPPPLPLDNDNEVEALLVVGGEAPIPMIGLGAPAYSPEQTAAVICARSESRSSANVITQLEQAHAATVRAKMSRRAFNLGKASQGEVNATEVERQKAISEVMRRLRVEDISPSVRDGLTVENLKQTRLLEHGQPVMLVSGSVRNFGLETREVPPVVLHAVDARGFSLAGQTNAIDAEILKPGETATFIIRFRNPPAYTAKFHGTFAPDFLPRAFRGCGFLDPSLYDSASLNIETLNIKAQSATRPPEGIVPPYVGMELAAFGRITFLDAMEAFNADREKDAGALPDGCVPPQSWRDLLRLGDMIEEAWVATNAAEEARRDAPRGIFTAEEVNEAEQARVAAIQRFMQARPSSRKFEAPSAALAFEKLTIQTDRTRANFFSVVGDLRNNGDTPVVKPPVLIQVKDRYGYVISERFHRLNLTVPPKRVAQFTFNFDLPRSLGNKLDVKLAC